MSYQSVISAVVRALAAETINSAGGCDFAPRVQAGGASSEISGKEARFLDDCWVFGRLHKHLEPHHWRALVAKYSTHAVRKHAAIAELAKAIQSPATERFRHAAVITWAMPKLQGVEGKRSTNVLPAGWYDMKNWDDDGRPEPTLYRWRSTIRKALELQLSDALMCAQEILDREGLIGAAA